MSNIEFVLIICGYGTNQPHVVLDMINARHNFPLYEVSLNNNGSIGTVNILPQGNQHPFNSRHTKDNADIAIDDILSLSTEDIERIAGNQLSTVSEKSSLWQPFDEGCYQYINNNLDSILSMGSPDPFEDDEVMTSESVESVGSVIY